MTQSSSFKLARAKRRQLLLSAAASAASSALGSWPMMALAQKAFKEDVDYTRLNPPQPTDVPGKIEVIEFFGFWCPHCNEFEPTLEAWVKKLPAEVAMRYSPIAFYDSQVPLQRLFYTLEVLGVGQALRPKVFAAIHVTHTPLDTGEQQADWAQSNGIDRKKYLDLYNSFSVQTSARRATSLATAYGVSSVPTLAVDGKYVVLGSAQALPTVDYLIGLERHASK